MTLSLDAVTQDKFSEFVRSGEKYGLGVRSHLTMAFENHASFFKHDESLAEALVKNLDGIAKTEVLSLVDNLADGLLEETISSSVNTDLNPESIQRAMTFQRRVWSSLSATMGRLAYMNGHRSENLEALIGEDDLSTNSNTSTIIAQNKELFPDCPLSHQIIAAEQKVREVFNQWLAGGDPKTFAKMLDQYYAGFKFDEVTANKYTDQSELIKLMVEELGVHLKENPLPQDTKIAIIGPGAKPFELEVIKKLIEEKTLSVSQIQGIDMQTAEELGLSEDELQILQTQKYRLVGGHILGNWIDGHAQSPEDQYDLAFFCGSVNNNTYDQLEPLKDFLNLTRMLKPGGLLVYDTASLEQSPIHLQKSHELLTDNSHLPQGARPSAHFPDSLAFIFPQHIIDLYLDLAGIQKKSSKVWQVDESKSRVLLVGQKQGERAPILGRFLETLLTSAFASDAPRPSPNATATAWWSQDQGAGSTPR